MVLFGFRAAMARQTARVKTHMSRAHSKPAPQAVPSTFSLPHSPSITKFNQQPNPPYSMGGQMPERQALSNLSPDRMFHSPSTTSLYNMGPAGNTSRSSLIEKGGGTYNSDSWLVY